MTELELQQYLLREYPQENARCEWKEFKNLKNSFCGDEKDDVISYVSAIANMEGGFLVVGVHDKTLEIVGTDTYNYDRQKAILRLTERCSNLSSVGLDIEEYVTDDTQKVVWVIHVPKHLPKRPVYAHDKAWQRIEDSLVELTQERLNAILDEPLYTKLLKENKNLTLEDCILLDTVQKGHRLNESDAKNLLERGLVEGEYPDLTISLSIARQTKQLPEYTKVKGLERDKIKQMALQFIQNAGEEGTKLDAILEYIKDVLPSTKSMEQKRRLLRHILEEMKNENMIQVNGRTWFENGHKS